MKLSLLKNPYTAGKGDVPVHHIQVNIAEQEWMKVYRTMPFHGFQDSFFATLYAKFVELTEHELPERHDLDTEEIIVGLLNRLTLKPKDTSPVFKGGTETL